MRAAGGGGFEEEAVGTPGPGEITPQEIAIAGFPADRAALQAIVDANDIPAMRAHAWTIWAGMTADSRSSFGGQTLPV